MSELVYTRVSTDEQSTLRQTHLLAEAGLVNGADGMRLFRRPGDVVEDPRARARRLPEAGRLRAAR